MPSCLDISAPAWQNIDMTNNDPRPALTPTGDPIADALLAAHLRRQASRATFIPNPSPARRLPPKSRRHSVPHKALR